MATIRNRIAETELEGDNYEIIYYDYTNTVSMYSENSFNVDLK